MATSTEPFFERHPQESPKDFIERLRRDKFRIGTGAPNMLAPDLHRTIQQLSVEIYPNDFHFIKEIVQNAEDNEYAEDVCPSLEFQLIKEDVAEVGASATLVVLNNELGLRSQDVVALCSAGKSTKIGRRDKGFIGSKGIGFKSVFMISETPMIISKGYRIRFRDTPTEEAGVGYVVPEWIESPSNEKILSAIGGDELPATVIVLPIRSTKVDLVRRQLKELSPEIILFLTRIRELKVVDKTNHVDSVDLLKITRSKPKSGITSDTCKFSEVILGLESSTNMFPHTFSYFIFQRTYPVTHPVQERKEVSEWTMTLAFPKEGRATSSQVGDIFSFLPTELRTGFPFIVNADFLLTTSRETIRFDSPWNVGILDCIAAAFEVSFNIMLRKQRVLVPQGITLISKALLSWNLRDAYKYLPHNTVWNAYRFNSTGAKGVRQVRQKLHVESQQAANLHQLDKVRTNIFERLEKSKVVCLSCLSVSNSKSMYYEAAKECVQMKSNFRDILKKAALSHHPSPSAIYRFPGGSKNPKGFAVVDEYIQENYQSRLVALGVPEMTTNQYLRFLQDAEWLVSLPEKVYVQVLNFFSYELKITEGSKAFRELKTIPLFRIKGEKGTKVASFLALRATELFYISSRKDAEWICAWAKEFKNWHVINVMPIDTSQALKEASDGEDLMLWIKKNGSLTELSAQKYAEKLIEELMVQRTKNSDYGVFSRLVMQFLYSGIRADLLSREVIVRAFQNRRHVSTVDHGLQERSVSLKLREEGGILLPRKVSKWPLLFSFAGGNFWHVIELSDSYLVPQSSLVAKVVNRSEGPDSMLEFVKQAFGAVDIPRVRLPASEYLPFHHPVTIEKSVLLFQWSKTFLPSRRITKSERENDRLLMSLKALQWVKTCHHGFQSPSSVFYPISHFENHFTPHDLPLLDIYVYSLDPTDFETQVALEELGVVTDMRKGGAAIAQYFSSRSAEELDQEVVNRFYDFFSQVGSEVDKFIQCIRVWTPTSGMTSLPTWRAPAECIISDQHEIFEESGEVTILDKLYQQSLLPFFSSVLHVPEHASGDLYRKIWLKWGNDNRVLKEKLLTPQSISLVKVQSIWKILLEDLQESSEEDWASFCSSAWVPVAPPSDDDEVFSETIHIVPSDEALIADDLALSEYFFAVADGKLNFAWLFPGSSAAQVDSLVKLYSKMGVRNFSKFVSSDIRMEPNVWKKKVPHGKGFICEGLFRCVLAYLCKHGVQFKDREQIVAPLMLATEVVTSEPFNVCYSLHIDTQPAPITFPTTAVCYYDKVKRKLYYLTNDHFTLREHSEKMAFNDKLVIMLCLVILPDHPELVQGLTLLLKLLCQSGFAMKCVEYELQTQNLSIFQEDEKLLMAYKAREDPKQASPSTDLLDIKTFPLLSGTKDGVY